MNLDETAMVANAGTVKVIGSKDVQKHTKIMDDNRDSITTFRCGSAAGIGGPQVYIVKGKVLEYKSFKHFTKQHKSPTAGLDISCKKGVKPHFFPARSI